MNTQCQSCGAFSGGHVPTSACENCGSVICANCKSHHKNGCDEIQRRKKLGQGPTVITHLHTPTDAVKLNVEAVQAALDAVDPILLGEPFVVPMTVEDTATVQATIPVPTEHEAGEVVQEDLRDGKVITALADSIFEQPTPEGESSVAIVPAPESFDAMTAFDPAALAHLQESLPPVAEPELEPKPELDIPF